MALYKRYRFGEWEVDTVGEHVRQRDVTVGLPRKSYQILLILIEARPRLVPWEELGDGIWSTRSGVQAALEYAVRDLLSSLGEDPIQPEIIETVEGVGYRFIGPIEQFEPTGNPAAVSKKSSAQAITRDTVPAKIPIDNSVKPVAKEPSPERVVEMREHDANSPAPPEAMSLSRNMKIVVLAAVLAVVLIAVLTAYGAELSKYINES